MVLPGVVTIIQGCALYNRPRLSVKLVVTSGQGLGAQPTRIVDVKVNLKMNLIFTVLGARPPVLSTSI